MDIFRILEKLHKIYPEGGFKFMVREDYDVYIYLPSPDGDGWYLEISFDTVSEFISWLE